LRLLCILLPHFPLRCEVLRGSIPDTTLAAVTYAVGSQKLILDYSPELHGLQRDMPVQQALSMHGEIELVYADMPYYWSVFNEVLDALELVSPLVEGRDLGEAHIGLDGLQHLYPTDDALISAVRGVIPEAVEVRFGIAGNKFLAYLVARDTQEGYQSLSEGVSGFLRDLSCDLLPISMRSKDRLHDFGLHTLGQVAALPIAHLQAQFGPEGKRIWELANGDDDTPLHPRITDELIEESTSLTSVTVSLDILLMTFEAMLAHVFARLESRGLGIRDITLWTRSWLAEYWERRIIFKEPVMNAKVVLSRFRQIMESSPQSGPVEQLGLRITGVGHAVGRQRSIFPEVRSNDQLFGDVKQLELHLGAPQLFKVKELEPWSRIPERRYMLTPLNR
jgi:DNA polymerase IV